MKFRIHSDKRTGITRTGSVGVRAPEGGVESTDILAALSGLDANRERAIAFRTRRVVQSSLGVLQEHAQGKARVRAVAIGVTFVVLLLITPLIWEAIDSVVAGEHLAEDPGGQLSLLALVMCPTILAAALVAGWWRRNR